MICMKHMKIDLEWDSNLRSLDTFRIISLSLSRLDLSLSPLRYRSDADMTRIKQYILYVGTNNRLFVPT